MQIHVATLVLTTHQHTRNKLCLRLYAGTCICVCVFVCMCVCVMCVCVYILCVCHLKLNQCVVCVYNKNAENAYACTTV